jgi:hypothetical protein
MRIPQLAWAVLGVALLIPPAQAQSNVRVRGTIVAVAGDSLAVKSRDGRGLKLEMSADVSIAVAKAVRFEDIKVGDYVGATTSPGPDGTLVALEVHYLAPTVQEGHVAWDLVPGSMMTNAKVGAVQTTSKRELSLQYKDGMQRITVPADAPIVRAVPGTRADLVAGEYVFIGAQLAPDGTLRAPRIQVSKDGVRPPQ